MTSDEEIKRAAKLRYDRGVNWSGYTPRAERHEEKGMIGERAFARLFGVDYLPVVRDFGDGGKDFVINGFSIDVKTADKPKYLLVPVNKVRADIYVLMKNLGTDACFIGYATKREVLDAQPADMDPEGDQGIVSHAIRRFHLHTLSELFACLRI